MPATIWYNKKMATLTYVLIPHPMKEISQALQLVEDGQEVTQDVLKVCDHPADQHSVMTLCDNFVTIYGLGTWRKKFGK
jgi:hypothetical protein